MAAAKKEYDDSLKKPKTVHAVKTPAGVKSVDAASAQTLELEAQLRTLQEHKSITDTISQQRQELWKQQSRFRCWKRPPKARADRR